MEIASGNENKKKTGNMEGRTNDHNDEETEVK